MTSGGNNWLDWVFKIVNFGVLVWLLVKFGGKPLKEFLVSRHNKVKDKIDEADRMFNEAEGLKKERLVVGQRGDRYEAGEVVLEIALIICSFTLLTKKKAFWYGGMLLGVLGVAIACSGFMLHG